MFPTILLPPFPRGHGMQIGPQAFLPHSGAYFRLPI
jgi:hypothetical protein